MHAGDVVERLRNPHPARQYGDICDEADIAHKLIAFGRGIAPEHSQFSLIWSQTKNHVERGALPCPIGTDKSEDAALIDTQIDAVERDGCSKRLTKTARVYYCHGFGSSSL